MNAALKLRIRSIYLDHVRLLERILLELANSLDRNLVETVWSLFSECLCKRDELDIYISDKGGKPSKSMLNCDTLDNFDQILAALADNDALEREESAEKVPELPIEARELIYIGLHSFGSSDESWKDICDVYFPTKTPRTVRQTYFRNVVEDVADDDSVLPNRWGKDDDYLLVEAIETYGRGKRAVHEAFISMSERRSVDQIQRRMEALLPKPRKKAYTKRVTPELPTRPGTPNGESGDSDWSFDDNLLRNS
jgi:hypothetical protein